VGGKFKMPGSPGMPQFESLELAREEAFRARSRTQGASCAGTPAVLRTASPPCLWAVCAACFMGLHTRRGHRIADGQTPLGGLLGADLTACCNRCDDGFRAAPKEVGRTERKSQ